VLFIIVPWISLDCTVSLGYSAHFSS